MMKFIFGVVFFVSVIVRRFLLIKIFQQAENDLYLLGRVAAEGQGQLVVYPE